MKKFDSVGQFWRNYVPAYKSKSFRPFHVGFPWNPFIAPRIKAISERRSQNRIRNYINSDELQRAKNRLSKNPGSDVSIRFGVSKSGHGYSGERGDFCLVAGVFRAGTLTLFYRSIELIGGFAFDLVLIRHIEKELDVKIKRIEIWAIKAFIFALKGNSNEKLYPKLRRILK